MLLFVRELSMVFTFTAIFAMTVVRHEKRAFISDVSFSRQVGVQFFPTGLTWRTARRRRLLRSNLITARGAALHAAFR